MSVIPQSNGTFRTFLKCRFCNYREWRDLPYDCTENSETGSSIAYICEACGRDTVLQIMQESAIPLTLIVPNATFETLPRPEGSSSSHTKKTIQKCPASVTDHESSKTARGKRIRKRDEALLFPCEKIP